MGQHDGSVEYSTHLLGSVAYVATYVAPVVGTPNHSEQVRMSRASQPLLARNLSDPSAQLLRQQRIHPLYSAGSGLDVWSHQDGIAEGPPLSTSNQPRSNMEAIGLTKRGRSDNYPRSMVPVNAFRHPLDEHLRLVKLEYQHLSTTNQTTVANQ
jgi:hypothetical protein